MMDTFQSTVYIYNLLYILVCAPKYLKKKYNIPYTMNAGIIIACIVALGIILRMYKMGKKNSQFEEMVEQLNAQLHKIRKENVEMEKRLAKPVTKKAMELATREHTIIINSADTNTEYVFPYKLKNVKNVELISGIVPKSEYRINPYNDKLTANATPITLTDGNYTDVITMLMHINQELYDNNTGVMMMYNSVTRNVIAVAPAGTVLDLTDTNSCAQLIGFTPDTYTFPSGTTHDTQTIMASLQYFYNLKTTSETSSTAINNLPANTYTFTTQFVSQSGNGNNISIDIDPAWEYIYGDLRVNMKHQLYVDIEIDEIQYWDGTHRLARIFIPEEKDETEYQSYGKPILRSLNQDYYDLDRLNFRLKSVVSETNKHPYDLKGLPYSLQVQITTVDPYLLRK